MTRTCPDCGGPLNELSVDGPVGKTVFHAVMNTSSTQTLRIQAVCEACDQVVEKEVVIDPYREIERWTTEPTPEKIAEVTNGDPKKIREGIDAITDDEE